jgi:cytochrome oxidase Cu insertion factor (SCO1/SenC/PrrC family)
MLCSIAVSAMLVLSPIAVSGDGPAAPDQVKSAPLAPGDAAPPFTLAGSDGRTYRLADFRGKQAVVVAWFAKAFTGG